MKSFTQKHWSLLTLFVISMVFTFSCKDDDHAPPRNPNRDNNNDDNEEETNPNVAVNHWIQDIMETWYYWNNDMKQPISTDADPENYFNALLVNQDRFSAIYPNYQELLSSLEGTSREAGYEFGLFRESESNNNVVAEVFYVKKGSPAADVDILRGDIITQVNGTTMTLNNYRTLLQEMQNDHTLTLFRYNEEEGRYTQRPEEVRLTTIIFNENPIFLDSVYTIDNYKIGYLVYHFFAPGDDVDANDGKTFGFHDQGVDNIFAQFKEEGITDFVLDLRYNSGGYASSAINLASLIGKSVTEEDIFYRTEYNSIIQPEFIRQFGQDALLNKFVQKGENIGNQLSNGTVYILTTDRTASASELIINGLSPYMEVVLIGDTTYGKNVGSIPLEDEENPNNPYGLLPIVSRSFNSLDQSDYINGFTPDIQAREFEERLRPFGHRDELLLRTAIAEITGQPYNGRIEKLQRTQVGSSLDHQLKFGVMIENKLPQPSKTLMDQEIQP